MIPDAVVQISLVVFIVGILWVLIEAIFYRNLHKESNEKDR